jgi:hypothetical protein
VKQAASGPLPLDALGIGLVVLTSFMWASSLVAGRFGVLAGMPPLTLATFRVIVAFLLLLMVVLATSRSLALPRKMWAPLTLMSVSHTGLSHGLSFLAVQTIPAGVGMVVMATQSFWVALIGHLFGKVRPQVGGHVGAVREPPAPGEAKRVVWEHTRTASLRRQALARARAAGRPNRAPRPPTLSQGRPPRARRHRICTGWVR